MDGEYDNVSADETNGFKPSIGKQRDSDQWARGCRNQSCRLSDRMRSNPCLRGRSRRVCRVLVIHSVAPVSLQLRTTMGALRNDWLQSGNVDPTLQAIATSYRPHCKFRGWLFPLAERCSEPRKRLGTRIKLLGRCGQRCDELVDIAEMQKVSGPDTMQALILKRATAIP